MSAQVTQFLERWHGDKAVADLLKRLARFQFIRLNPLSSLELRFPPHLIFYKYEDPIIGPEGVTVEEPTQLPLGKMFTMHSLIGTFGYLFEFPNAKVVHGPGYFGVSRRANVADTEAQVTLKSTYLNIFSSEIGVLCVGKIEPNFVERYGFKDAKPR